jgi:hypothetical protein
MLELVEFGPSKKLIQDSINNRNAWLIVALCWLIEQSNKDRVITGDKRRNAKDTKAVCGVAVLGFDRVVDGGGLCECDDRISIKSTGCHYVPHHRDIAGIARADVACLKRIEMKRIHAFGEVVANGNASSQEQQVGALGLVVPEVDAALFVNATLPEHKRPKPNIPSRSSTQSREHMQVDFARPWASVIKGEFECFVCHDVPLNRVRTGFGYRLQRHYAFGDHAKEQSECSAANNVTRMVGFGVDA